MNPSTDTDCEERVIDGVLHFRSTEPGSKWIAYDARTLTTLLDIARRSKNYWEAEADRLIGQVLKMNARSFELKGKNAARLPEGTVVAEKA